MRAAAAAVAVVEVAVALLLASQGRADTPPGSWECARDPEARARWALHVRAQQLLFPIGGEEMSDLEQRRRVHELQLEHARAMLEAADAEHSPDVRLRFDLGAVYVQLANLQQGDALYEQAIAVLAPALDAEPDHPASTAALYNLADAYAHLDRGPQELATWRRHLARLSDDGERVVEMMNMGEAEMRLGFVDDALGTFREVLHLCGELPNTGGSTYVLALWDLAVALDRSGDPRGAVEAAAKASSVMVYPSNRHNPVSGRTLIAPHARGGDPAVFFAPEWQRDWYLALGATAAAGAAHDARDQAAQWADAETHWDVYIAGASSGGSTDPWLATARKRRENVHTERLAAEKRAAKLPRLPAGRGTWIGE
jgi:tetratricopeptide (TPR) repeat protein